MYSNFVEISRLLAFFCRELEFREMGTPEARNLISVRCGFTVFLFLEGDGK